MTQALLIEIGVEELPAIPLLKIVSNIEKSWKNILEEYNLSCNFEFVYTPRRLVLKHAAMATSQADSTVEFFGPPMVAAVKDGTPTKAAEGFARKCGVGFEELGPEHVAGVAEKIQDQVPAQRQRRHHPRRPRKARLYQYDT